MTNISRERQTRKTPEISHHESRAPEPMLQSHLTGHPFYGILTSLKAAASSSVDWSVVASCILFADEAIFVNIDAVEKGAQLCPQLWFWRNSHVAKNEALTFPVLVLPYYLI